MDGFALSIVSQSVRGQQSEEVEEVDSLKYRLSAIYTSFTIIASDYSNRASVIMGSGHLSYFWLMWIIK